MRLAALMVSALLALPAFAQEGFRALDRNGDGVLSQREAMPDPRVGENFERLDANGDRVLSAREYRLLLL